MMRASWKAYVLSFLVLVGGAAVLRGTYEPPSRDTAGADRPAPTIQDVENQLRQANLQVARSEEAEVFLRKDVAEVEKRLKSPQDIKDYKEATQLLRAGIFLLDREALKNYTTADRRRLYSAVVSFVDAQKEAKRPGAAQAVTLALRLLGKLPEPPADSLDRKLVLSLLEPGLDRRRALIAIELVSRWERLPAEAHERLRADMLAPDAHTARTAINLVTAVRDPKAKTALLNLMADSYADLHDLARPMALKVWVAYRSLVKKDYSRELARAKERDGDYWEDAAVGSIEKLDSVSGHENYLRDLYAKTTNPLIQQRVSALLGRTPAAEGTAPDKGGKGSQ